MTTREAKLCKAILDALHDLDGGQYTDIQIHGDLFLRGLKFSLAELEGAIAICSVRKWIIGAPGVAGKMKWNISDRGETARLELV
jgi:hypothetical protein